MFHILAWGFLRPRIDPVTRIRNNSILRMSCTKRALESPNELTVGKIERTEANENAHATPIQRHKRFRVDINDSSLEDSDYYIENGLRKVYPYTFTFRSFCKGRWVGQKLSELFEKEFRAVTEELMNFRCKSGMLKVNGEIVTADYILKDNDFITNQIHRHEFPVLAAPIPIIHADDNLLVIDKPPSLPVHPCGKYRFNTITSLLEKEKKIKDVHVVHRLDRLTSGVMIMAKTKAKAQKLHEEMRNREMRKEYVCRVEGKFPDGQIECNEPIETLSHKIGICIVSKNGKPCKTVFERLNYNGKSSTVLCKPFTGRMHQIRVHLQYLGFPITNDSFYNSQAFGPNKGKGSDFGKSIEQLLKDIESEHQRSKYILKNEADVSLAKEDTSTSEKNAMALKALQHYTSQESWQQIKKNYEFDSTKVKRENGCEECSLKCCDPTPSEQFIYLHALRYQGPEWFYETQMPIWASESWTYD